MNTRGEGPIPNELMLVSDYPGKQEARRGRPLVGRTGDEVNRYLDGVDLPERRHWYLTNLCKHWNEENIYTADDYAQHKQEVLSELVDVNPSLIVTLGRASARFFLGDVDMEDCASMPWRVKICVTCQRPQYLSISYPKHKKLHSVAGYGKQGILATDTGLTDTKEDNNQRTELPINCLSDISPETEISTTCVETENVLIRHISNQLHKPRMSNAGTRHEHTVNEDTYSTPKTHIKDRSLLDREENAEHVNGSAAINGNGCICGAGKKWRDVVIFTLYNPAAGFRSPELQANVSYGFQQLALYMGDKLEARELFDDKFPNPVYFEITSPLFFAHNYQTEGIHLSLDTEGRTHAPWSVQICFKPGTAYMIRATRPSVMRAFLEWLVDKNIRVTYHSALHDRPMLRAFARLVGCSKAFIKKLDAITFDDTMVMAYLLQVEPKGLKPLGARFAGMRMQNYQEILGDAQRQLALDYCVSLWDIENVDWELRRRCKFDIINRTPLYDKAGNIKRSKDGQIKYRRTTVLPNVPKSDLHKATERCLRSKEAFDLWHKQFEDIKVAGYRLLGDMPHASLSQAEFPVALVYGCRDADATKRVEPELMSCIRAKGLEDTYRLEMGTYPLIDRMGTIGIKPNLAVFERLSEKLEFHICDLQMRLEKRTGRIGFNANSGNQVSDFLFDTLRLDGIKMTASGDRYSTDDKILEALEREHGLEFPVISDIREYRETYKLKNTFVERISDFVNRWPYDGRVHPTFRTTSVITGRLSASDPNWLAQPEHGKFANDFKLGWEAEDGHVFFAADESQIELRILAHLSQDPVLLEAYRYTCDHGPECVHNDCVLKRDLHARLAHQIFGVLPSLQDKSRHRLPSKTTNFGLAMGMTCYGLMIELRRNGVEVDERGAQEWIDGTNKLYRKVPAYKAEKIAEARRNGYVRCLSGRIRYIGGIRSWDEATRAEAERFAFSTPIQEGAQWIMKQAEYRVWNDIILPLQREGHYIEPLAQIHDALKFEVAEGLQYRVREMMEWAMTKAPKQISVPLAIESEWGYNLAPLSFHERGMRSF